MPLKDTIISQMNTLGTDRKPFLFILSFDGNHGVVKPLDDISSHDILFDFNGVTNAQANTPTSAVALEANPLSFETYKKQFDYVHHQLQIGNSYLTNLTIQTPIALKGTLQEVFYSTKAKYRLCVNDQFVCFSPEIFVQIKDNKILSFPMKGTIKADLPNAAEQLLNDEKETAEHYTIVDLIRNDLNIVSKKVKVNRFRYLDRLETSKGAILQMSSEISGELTSDWHQRIGDIFNDLLPAGSITGSPKESTVNIINAAETYERNYYTGICGIYNGMSIDSAVMIRFIEKQQDNYVYKSGGGITSSSDVMKEYEELLQKIYIPN